jgi:hypothetical protein
MKSSRAIDKSAAHLMRAAFVDVVLSIIRFCHLTRYDQLVVVCDSTKQRILSYVYATIQTALDGNDSYRFITCLVLLSVLGIELEEYDIVHAVLADTYPLFKELHATARAVWIDRSDYRQSPTYTALSEVLLGRGALLRNVERSRFGITFDLHQEGLKQCFVRLGETVARSLYGVTHFPYDRAGVVRNLRTRCEVQSTLVDKAQVALWALLAYARAAFGSREVPVSIGALLVWLVQAVGIWLFVEALSLLQGAHVSFFARVTDRLLRDWL